MKNLVIITGTNRVGKTTIGKQFLKAVSRQEIRNVNSLIEDSQFLLEAMRLDDARSGFHHTHEWVTNPKDGHTHAQEQPEFPFTVLDNILPNEMRHLFFTKLTTLPQTGIWFTEWAGGRNTNPLDDPFSKIDYSYTSIVNMLRVGTLSTAWLERVSAVIHLVADMSVRFLLNEQAKKDTSQDKEETDTGSWSIDQRVINFYGYDDFLESGLEMLFKAQNIPIHEIKNDGTYHFFEHLQELTFKTT